MKKISVLALLMTTIGANAATYDADKFRSEILTGVDMIGARATVNEIPISAPGELGREVYEITGAINPDDIQMYIPTSMYVRMGGGLNLGFATSRAIFDGNEFESSGSYTTRLVWDGICLRMFAQKLILWNLHLNFQIWMHTRQHTIPLVGCCTLISHVAMFKPVT